MKRLHHFCYRDETHRLTPVSLRRFVFKVARHSRAIRVSREVYRAALEMTKPTGTRPKSKTKFGFVMSSAWYTRIGNLPENWSASASQLFAAAMILRQEREKERSRFLGTPPDEAGLISVAIGTNSVEQLLTAFGLEALLKAVGFAQAIRLLPTGSMRDCPVSVRRNRGGMTSLLFAAM